MTHASADRHVYLREIAEGKRTSLSVLAGLVARGSRVLDLGTGSGALGHHLREHAGCVVDGLTINDKEAQLARPSYRRVEVANLEQPGWPAIFGDEKYDYIVCADVLEHLREPESVLRECPALLAPGGRLLISVPNAAYGGLVAELLEGRFTYREEGLLDRTHLRFFTRRSLGDFLAAEGWGVDAIERIELPLTESEFRAAFDQLPPAVARYLLALPDAGTYQLIVTASPGARAGGAHAHAAPPAAPAKALFSAQLYFDLGTGFQEDGKVTVAGEIGRDRQLLTFPLPSGRVQGLRFDPADRPGFLRLYRMRLRRSGSIVWEWSAEADTMDPLEEAPHHDMKFRGAWASSAALVLLHGDDPSIELPIPQSALQACEGGDAVFEADLGWPMSGDFMALAEVVPPLERQVEALRADAAVASESAKAALGTANARIDDLEQRRQVLDKRRQELEAQLQVMTERNERAVEEKNAVARQRLALQGELASLGKQYQALGEHLHWIENSTVFRATRPLVRAKMAAERVLGLRGPDAPAPAPQPQPVQPRVDTVDVIVPVYRGLADTQLCVRSALASRCRTPFRLVILNDASPEPEVTQWLRDVSRDEPRIVLLENEENLGFVGTVNRGMALDHANDVLLLNSDTEVANDWLDRLRDAAYSDRKVASVTPFSNNATICSYPRFCEPNELPEGWSTAALDALFARVNASQVVDVPTGVGFCMYIRRDCLDEVGMFDVAKFGKGYGEENDFCRRAAEAGWRNLHALDTFVLHTGGVSFGASKSQREIEAVEKLRVLHPDYDRVVHQYVTADPARTARLAVDLARVDAAGLPGVLAVLHDRGGGTRRHVVELAQHMRGQARFFSLTPAPGGTVWLELVEAGAGFRLEFAVPGEWPALLQALRALGIAHLHYHHLLGHKEEVLTLGEQLGVQWDFTVHDYYNMCPQISLTDASDRYCGEEGDGQCGRCLQHTPAPGGLDITAWRQRHGGVLMKARHVLAPSRDTARRFARMWPSADVRVAPHTDLPEQAKLPEPKVLALAPGAPLKVAVIGALSRIKGADLLEDVASLAAKTHAPVEFHLIGHAYRELRTQPRAALTVHGQYQEGDLEGLLDWIKPDLVWFPALWPETYSYTLSACLEAGLPVVAPDIGAFPERLTGRKWSWVLPWDAPAARFLAFFAEVREKNFSTAQPPATQWTLAAAHVDSAIGPWSYEADYFRNVAPVTASVTMDAEFLATHSRSRATGAEAQQRRLRQWALGALVRLRSAPAMRQVARAIPLRWQTRVKSWLRA